LSASVPAARSWSATRRRLAAGFVFVRAGRPLHHVNFYTQDFLVAATSPRPVWESSTRGRHAIHGRLAVAMHSRSGWAAI